MGQVSAGGFSRADLVVEVGWEHSGTHYPTLCQRRGQEMLAQG